MFRGGAFLAVAILVAGCASGGPTAAPTSTPGDTGLPNPAAVYCEQQGGRSEIRTAADGSQYGVCVFPDGSECDEWKYYRGECQPGEGQVQPTEGPTAEPPAEQPSPEPIEVPTVTEDQPTTAEGEVVDGWAGHVVKLPPGNQFGQYFERDDGQRYDIGSSDPDVGQQLAEVRATGEPIRVWGKLLTGEPATLARHIEVERLETQAQGATNGEAVDGWTGTVVKLPAGNQFGQYFARDDGQKYDIGSADPAVMDQVTDARWKGTPIRVWGKLLTGVPAYQARYIDVERLEPVPGGVQQVRDLAPLAQFTASSTMPAEHAASYFVYNAADGSPETAWVEGANGPGVGEWLMLTFPWPVVLERIGVDVGYDRDAESFAANNRMKKAAAVFSDGREVELSFADKRGVQVVSLAAPVETTTVKLVIREVYPGATYDDTCLAEVQVWGTTR